MSVKWVNPMHASLNPTPLSAIPISKTQNITVIKIDFFEWFEKFVFQLSVIQQYAIWNGRYNLFV